jgi:hypothetical protein
MDTNRRKELVDQFKEIKTYMGVIQVTNTQNGKRYIDGYPNLKNKWHTLQMQLNLGSFANPEFVADWKRFGQEAFTYEVLEEVCTEDVHDVKWELKQLEKKWLERLQPYGDQGYNRPPRVK